MTKTAKRVHLRTCFISANGTVRLDSLTAILADNDVELIAPSSDSVSGLTAFEGVAAAIRRADFIVGVLTGGSGDDNVMFELGFAHALKKPLAVVGPQNARIPEDLSSELFIPNGLSNPEGLRFNMEEFLSAAANPRRGQNTQGLSRKPVLHVNIAGHPSKGRALEQKVADLFRSSGGSLVTVSSEPKAGADLAIWIEDLSPLIGNPILVEVKRELASLRAARTAANEAYQFLARSGARLVLILYESGPPSEKLNVELSSAVVFFVRLKEFTKEVKALGPASVISRMRNRALHGAG